MKKLCAAGLVALCVLAATQQRASAWVNSRFSVGLSWDFSSGNNSCFWGAFRNGQVPNPWDMGGYGSAAGPRHHGGGQPYAPFPPYGMGGAPGFGGAPGMGYAPASYGAQPFGYYPVNYGYQGFSYYPASYSQQGYGQQAYGYYPMNYSQQGFGYYPMSNSGGFHWWNEE